MFLLGTDNAVGGGESLTFLIQEQGCHQLWGWGHVKTRAATTSVHNPNYVVYLKDVVQGKK